MTDEEYFSNTAFCPLPWTSFFIWPTGEIETCCTSSNKLGNFNNEKVSDMLSSKKYIKIKSDMRAGIAPAGCASCQPQKGIDSENFNFNRTLRYDFLTTLQDTDKSIYDTDEGFEFRYADLRFRNTCNFACVYCGPGFSSLWAQELNQASKVNNEKIQQLLDFFNANVHTLKVLYLAGGEPLMIKENEAILQKLLEVNPDCEIRVNTNLSVIENNKIFDLLLQFKNCKWRISVDDSEDRFGYIRHPGNWETFYKNLMFLKSKVSVYDISFSMVYLALNAKTIFDTIALLEKDGFPRYQFDIFYIHSGIQGAALDPRNLPTNYLKEVLEVIDNNQGEHDRFNQNLDFIKSCLENVSTQNSENHLINELTRIDQRRNLDSQTIFSDIYRYCNQ